MFRRLICVLLFLAPASANAEEVRLTEQERFYGLYPGMTIEKALDALKASSKQRHPQSDGRVKVEEWLKPDGKYDGIFTIVQYICEHPCQRLETVEVTATPMAMGGHVARISVQTQAAGTELFHRTVKKYEERFGAPRENVDAPLRRKRAWAFNDDGMLEISVSEPDGAMRLWFESAALQAKVHEAMATYRYRDAAR